MYAYVYIYIYREREIYIYIVIRQREAITAWAFASVLEFVLYYSRLRYNIVYYNLYTLQLIL